VIHTLKNRALKTHFDDERLMIIKKALDDDMSKAAACRTFEVKRSTLIDSLNRLKVQN